MGRLLRTTAAFRLFGLPRPGIPFLVDFKMRIVEAPTRWLLSLATSGGGKHYSHDTLRTYAEALDDFFEALELSQWAWNELTRDDIDEYVASLNGRLSDHTKRPIGAKTINLRVRVISKFYQWAVSSKLLRTSPIAYRIEKVYRSHDSALMHTRTPAVVQKNAHLVRDVIREPHAISRGDLQKLLTAFSPVYRLLAECALTSGARRIELAKIEISDWLNPVYESAASIAIKPTYAKGGNTAPLYFPRSVYDRVVCYIREERELNVRNSSIETRTVFVNRNGKSISRELITQTFYRAAKRCNVRASFHDLRHTFISRVAHQLKQTRRIDTTGMNTALILKVLARHRSILSTFLYVHDVGDDPDILALAVNQAYNKWR